MFEAMGSQVVHVGEPGMGILFKLVLNHLLGTSMVVFAEGLHLGVALGIPQERLLSMLLGTVVVPAYSNGKREKLATGVYDPEFPLQWMQKDMQMVAETGYTAGVAMPIANLTKEMCRLAIQDGLSEVDFSAIYHYLNPILNRASTLQRFNASTLQRFIIFASADLPRPTDHGVAAQTPAPAQTLHLSHYQATSSNSEHAHEHEYHGKVL
ncbi:MAG: NAD(P)-dependent oxidoreductase [Chloroflexaceae bacterium]|nr:NAD(P)-dependent oxidoreductase [Chloroflexaceae bacterium]